MQVNQRKAGILLNYLGEGVKIITALVYTPLMLRLLGQSEYGLYQLVYSTVSWLSVLSLGFGSSYVRYFSRFLVRKDDAGIAKLNGMFMVIFCAMAVICLLCGGVLYANAGAFFGENLTSAELSKAKVLLAISVFSMALTFPSSVFNCYVTAHEEFIFQKLLTLASGILNPFLTLPLLLMGYDSVAVVAVTALLCVVSLVANMLFCRGKLRMVFALKGMDFSLLREMWGFTFFIFLNQIIDQVNWSVDKFLLGRMSGTAAVAVYGVGAQINSLYLQTSTSISCVYIPKINRIVAENDDNTQLVDLMIKVGRVQYMVLALVLTGFLLFGQAFVRLWAGVEYAQSYWVAILLISPTTIPLIQNVGIEIQRAKNKHCARSIVLACISAGNILVSIYLIRLWGCVGAALGTAFAITFGNTLFMNWYYHLKLGLDMVQFWREILRLLPSTAIACLVGRVIAKLFPITSWGSLALMIALYTMIYTVFVWLLGMNTQEKKQILQMLRKR